MPMAAVSVRETNRSDHSPYAAVSPQVSPRSTAVASASTRPSPDSMSASTDSRVTAASNIVRRAASSTSVTSARQCGTVTWSGCWSHVIGSSRSPRSSSSRASASSWVSTMRAIAPVDGHHGRGCLSQPAASAPSTNWRSAVNGARCRRPRTKAGSSHSMRISSHASAIWSRDDITTSLDARRRRRPVRTRPPSCRGPRRAEKQMRPLVGVGIGLAGGAPEAGSPADQRLVDLLPEGRRPHEGLVVEAGAEHRRGQSVHRHQVEGEGRPAVLAARCQSRIQLRDGCPRVRLPPRSGAQFDECIGLFGACRQDAARPVIFERAADQRDTVGKQSGGERVAGMALIVPSIEGERQCFRAVDQSARSEAIGLRGAARSACCR